MRKRNNQTGSGRKRFGPQSATPNPDFNPRINPALKSVLDQIGTPDPQPFVPDPFQLEALEELIQGDVIVSAPTGSGKTYIAVEAMARVFRDKGRAWYASPLKALSNSKYLEFCQKFGSENVGLLTGDHKVNADAPLIVGTTEILRNQLYDAMHHGENLAADLVVMDEAHYLGDQERGVVWEEVIIYLHPRVKLLLLSATIANAREIADWLAYIRKEKSFAVITSKRPVPLFPLFLFPDGELTALQKGGDLAPGIKHFIRSSPQGRRRGPRVETPYGGILRVLGKANLLPAIFFLKSRSDCDLALGKSHSVGRFRSPEDRYRLETRLDELLEKYPFLKTHGHLKYLRGWGVASHHAGHLPHWKLMIEQLMQEGLLTAIFSTSTVAAGVNFPARTVVICQSDRFNGREFLDLTATELLQMTGRAGRRGMDHIGFALTIPGPFQNVALINSLFGALPDPVRSQIQINFSMTLNLMMSHSPEQIRTLLGLSLAAFQQGRSKHARDMNELMNNLGELLKDGECPGPEEAVIYSQTIQRLQDEAGWLKKRRPLLEWEAGLKQGLLPGRLFEAQSGQRYCFMSWREKRGRNGVMAARLHSELALKRGEVRQKWLPMTKIFALLNTRLDFDDDASAADKLEMIQNCADKDFEYLSHRQVLEAGEDPALNAMDNRLRLIENELKALPCNICPEIEKCGSLKNSKAASLLRKLRQLESDSESSGRLLWASFLRHLQFLKSENFISTSDELTEDGYWAAQLRLDHPLIIAAGIRAQVWPKDNPALLAALVAPFVVDREIESDSPFFNVTTEFQQAWQKLETAIQPTIARLAAAGFHTPQLKLRPALAIHHWAQHEDWDSAVRIYGQDQGDMAMLVFRTADHLRQLAALTRTHPDLAPRAREAVDLILKEPVTIPF